MQCGMSLSEENGRWTVGTRDFPTNRGQGPEPDCGLEAYPVKLDEDGKIWLELPG